MAAGEDEPQEIVLHDLVGVERAVRVEGLERLVGVAAGEILQLGPGPFLAGTGAFAADDVDRLAPGGHGQPGPRLRRYAGHRPRAESGQRGLLDRVLGELDVA